MEVQIVTDFLCDCGLEICDVEHFFCDSDDDL